MSHLVDVVFLGVNDLSVARFSWKNAKSVAYLFRYESHLLLHFLNALIKVEDQFGTQKD